ncbi:MAG: Spx/MgsR family RNA polymerase-binding regulatory protein [Haliscomenobacter sp.]|uniref:Spx/MgsR family RNA polymerase-binding regulatory protein n=1 Tax=Haliscomenobacter sp. TaxID=2717303 RepID=UPI0029A32FF1|nr:Spx/MgsR family RNA polymerase-binding regulatory protein [Haliscomenobacter sp.]MDX2066797.1 Spx/MgsR family RNA polymerase-binding regulatory protein [Haliscomenobacter sp.]
MLTIYGISNCDTVRKALKWLDKNGLAYTFFDYKAQVLPSTKLESWMQQKSWTEILNTRSTTWRELPQALKNTVVDAPSAIKVIPENFSMIKRPLVEQDGKIILLGFDEKQWVAALS